MGTHMYAQVCVLVRSVGGWGVASTLCPSSAWGSPSHGGFNGSLGSRASALGMPAPLGGSARRCGQCRHGNY